MMTLVRHSDTEAGLRKQPFAAVCPNSSGITYAAALDPRWSLIGFAGVGYTDNGRDGRLHATETVVAGGGGFSSDYQAQMALFNMQRKLQFETQVTNAISNISKTEHEARMAVISCSSESLPNVSRQARSIAMGTVPFGSSSAAKVFTRTASSSGRRSSSSGLSMACGAGPQPRQTMILPWRPPQNTRTWCTCSPCSSCRCTAQAMHGSNEWMVRRISIGWSDRASVWPTSAASYALGIPAASRGAAFHVVGTTH